MAGRPRLTEGYPETSATASPLLLLQPLLPGHRDVGDVWTQLPQWSNGRLVLVRRRRCVTSAGERLGVRVLKEHLLNTD